MHIGDGTGRENLCPSRNILLDSFLDHVQDNAGRLIILGDFLELWWYKPQAILKARKELFDRIEKMDVTIIPGNHDTQIKNCGIKHPLFNNISDPFIKKIGNNTFKFVHGHEVDPFMNSTIQKSFRAIGNFLPALRKLNQKLSADTQDQSSQFATHFSQQGNSYIPPVDNRRDKTFLFFKRNIRDKQMISRFRLELENDRHDITVAGHTHDPGCVDNWYINSGSWTKKTNDFLLITPNGETEVLHWTRFGTQHNKKQLN